MDRGDQIRRSACGSRIDRLSPQTEVLRGGRCIGEIAAVGGKMAQQRQCGASEQRPAKLGSRATGQAREADKPKDEGVELRAQAMLEDIAPGLQLDLAEAAWVAADPLPVPCQGLATLAGVQQRAHLVHEVVTGAAIARPLCAKHFVRGEDLLDPQAQRPGSKTARGARRVQCGAQPLQVARRITQPIHMVHTQAIHASFRNQTQRQGMNRLEAMHLQRGQRGNGEEPAVVDPVIAAAPPRQTIRLRGQQIGQRLGGQRC